MTKDLEAALRHIKTRADAWAVNEIRRALEQEPCEKSMNKAYEFGNHKGVGVYWNTETNTVELPKAVFEYILRQIPSRKDNIECEWAKMTYDTDNKENKIMFEFSDGTKKHVTYTEEIKRTTVGE